MRKGSSASGAIRWALLLTALAASGGAAAGPPPKGRLLASETGTGKVVTPGAAPRAVFQELDPRLEQAPERRIGWAGAVSASPDGKLMAVLTSGFSPYYDASGKILEAAAKEFLFIYDIEGGAPKQRQALAIANTFPSLVWGPASDRIYVSAGKDDAVLEYVRKGDAFEAGRTFALGHKACLGVRPDMYCAPVAGGLAVSPDGGRLLATNIQNDSVSLIDLERGAVLGEQDLRPGAAGPQDRGKPGGSYPRAAVWTSNDRAFVASPRDREVVSLEVSGASMRVSGRVAVPGQPAALASNRKGTRIFVAVDTTNTMSVVDADAMRLIENVDTSAPRTTYANAGRLGGANANSLVLAPGGAELLVTNGGQNSLAVIHLSPQAADIDAPTAAKGAALAPAPGSSTVGLVPTGWYPTGVAVSQDGGWWYVVNGKSLTGPNSDWCRTAGPTPCPPGVIAEKIPPFVKGLASNGVQSLLALNRHVNQLEKGGLLAMRAPSRAELASLTAQTARNNRMDRPREDPQTASLFRFLHAHIRHVIYIMKENRTFDQVLGDLGRGDGDPRLTLFPEAISPNHHALARQFVTVDNLLVSGEGSATGRNWTFAAQTPDFQEHEDPIELGAVYKGETAGFNYDTFRDVLTAYATSAERHRVDPGDADDPDVLPGTGAVFAPDGPGGEAGRGYLWDSARRAGLSVRNYLNFTRLAGPPSQDMRAEGRKMIPAYLESLVGVTDVYYPYSAPDFWRAFEWRREFREFERNGNLPSLETLWLPGDHLGPFYTGPDGVDTPDTQMADNDYAVGEIIEAVAHSRYAKDTLVITIEDDASDGTDHVDSQRSVMLIAGPYVRRGTVLSKRYTTVNVVRTIEDVLGIGPNGLNDGLAEPMPELFGRGLATWTYKASVPDVLRSTKLPLPPATGAEHVAMPRRTAAYWRAAMAGQDFSEPDRVEPVAFSRALWQGLKGDKPYPLPRPGQAQTDRNR
jgi:DNA-binding beta-propeller fold protein YncE